MIRHRRGGGGHQLAARGFLPTARLRERFARHRRLVGIERLEPRCVLAAPTILAVAPVMGASELAVDGDFTVTFDEAMDAATINAATIELRDPIGHKIPAAVTYDPATKTATLDPVSDLPVVAQYFTANVRGGDAGVKSEIGDPLSADFHWSASTGSPDFEQSVVFSGLMNPTVLKFARDGRAFVAEKSGRIWVYDSLTDTTPDLFANLHVNVHNFWDRGLLGMELAPNFPDDPHIYVLYTYDGDIPGTMPGGNAAVAAPKYGNGIDLDDPGPDSVGQGAWVSGRLSRLTANGNSMIGQEEVLIHDWPQQFPSHSIGTIAFGSDGALYAGAGDGASFLYADFGQPIPPDNPGNPFGDPVNEGGALRSQDLLSPDDPTVLNGSIIRIDPNTGAALPTNPLFAQGHDENARRIIAHGLRNPYRFTFRPGTNEIWIADVGWEDWEEIDRIVSPTDEAVENFGWPAYEGPNRQTRYDDLDLPPLEGLYAAGPDAHQAPFYTYHHTQKVDPTANEPISRFASITGIAFAEGDQLPAAFDGALFFADWTRHFLWVMYRGVDGLPDPTNIRAITGAAQYPVNLEIGPDGNLYYADFDGHKIWRVQFVEAEYGFTGTAGDDLIWVRASADGSLLEIYDNPPDPGAAPIFTWPMDAQVPLPIDLLEGNDIVNIELPDDVAGPAGGITLDAGAGNNLFHMGGGRVRIDSMATGGSLWIGLRRGESQVNELTTNGFNQTDLAVISGKATILAGGSGASTLTSLEVQLGSTLDITDNAVVVDYDGTSPAAVVRERILSGRGGAGLGKPWTGTGITSSAAAQANAGAPDSWSVGYVENALLPLGAYSTFRGQTVDASSVLIAFTRTGDANLDGRVDNDDVSVLAANYAPEAPKPVESAWALGDFDFNGFVDNDDVTLLGAFYQGGAAAGPPNYELQITNYELGIAKDQAAIRTGTVETLGGQDARGRETRTEPALADLGELSRVEPAARAGAAKQSFAGVGSQAELVNQERQDRLVDLLAEAIASDAAEVNRRLAGRRRVEAQLPAAIDDAMFE